MYISKETHIQTEQRLLKVLQSSSLKFYDRPYFFVEYKSKKEQPFDECLAMVRDDEVWSYLIPSKSDQTENFKIFSFHFKEGLDNSGFVGWLATKIKERFGSGVFVICGQNSNRGGVFDYWGCPFELAEPVETFIKALQTND